MSGGRILIADDEPQIRRVMRAALTSAGFEVSDARNGEQVVEALRAGAVDLVLLDMNMPGAGGIETCRAIRGERPGAEIAIIMLTVRGSEKDKVMALDAGADDYVTKPFSMAELLARIRATLRRVPPAGEAGVRRLALDCAEVDFQSRQVTVNGNSTRLTPKEFEVLRFMVARPNRVVSHRELLQAVWGSDYGDQVEYVRVVVNQLRRKIETNPSKPQYLLTEPWVGYRFRLPENE